MESLPQIVFPITGCFVYSLIREPHTQGELIAVPGVLPEVIFPPVRTFWPVFVLRTNSS